MNFFKRLFSSGSNKQPEKNENAMDFKGIYSKEGFNERYVEENIYKDPLMLDGCLKMIEGYLMANKIVKKVDSPVNHPDNLDQVIDEGFGFDMYCKAFQLGDSQVTMFLAYAFSDYLIKTYDFKLYIDKKPELPLRSMTLKFDKNDVVLSLYPFEYAAKVLNYESSFKSLTDNIHAQLKDLPQINDIIDRFIKPEGEEQQ